MIEPLGQSGGLSRWTVVAMASAGGALMLAALTGASLHWVAAVVAFVTDGGLAALVFLAGGGYGYLLVRRVAPASAPTALRVFTACGLGMILLSTAVLAAGSFFHGLLRPWVWWPVICVGVLAAIIQGRKAINSWRLPAKMDGWALIWAIMAAAAAFWIAGSTLPPGTTGGWTNDFYDILEYHLQVPREYYLDQHIHPLNHNCYSFYPLGVEMLFLLAMCLRDGAYQGMYAATAMHGCFVVLAVAAVWATLKRTDRPRAAFSAALLASAPFVLYLSGLAMDELAMIAYLALTALWLREWIADGSLPSAVCLGLMAGASLAVKYLSVGFVAGPVLAAMLAMAIVRSTRARRLAHVALAGAVAMAVFSPWLIRNAVSVGNPVFPLATQVLGRGHWSSESEMRWIDGHGPQDKPPVPVPPGWKAPPERSPGMTVLANFLVNEFFDPILVLLAAVAIGAALLGRASPEPWTGCLAGILAIQIVVWLTATHDSPPRFLSPAVVPMALLAGHLLATLFRVARNPLKGPGGNPLLAAAPPPSGKAWGRTPAMVIFLLTILANFGCSWLVYMETTSPLSRELILHGVTGEEVAWKSELKRMKKLDLDDKARFLLVGDAKAFYFPPGTLYATAFDANPLAEIASRDTSPEHVLRELKACGVTHIWVEWPECLRLASTYGYDKMFSAELFDRWAKQQPPGLKVIDQLAPLGLKKVCEIDSSQAESRPASQSQPVWPMVTVYALP